MSTANNSAPQQEEAKGVLRLAIELLRSEEKSAADREAKLAVIKFLAALEGRGEEYLKGFREGYAEGFKSGFALRVTEAEAAELIKEVVEHWIPHYEWCE